MKVSAKTLNKIALWMIQFQGEGVYNHDALSRDWINAVGIKAPNWPTHSFEETILMQMTRFKPRTLAGPRNARFVWGWELSDAIGLEFVQYRSMRMSPTIRYADVLGALNRALEANLTIA